MKILTVPQLRHNIAWCQSQAMQNKDRKETFYDIAEALEELIMLRQRLNQIAEKVGGLKTER